MRRKGNTARRLACLAIWWTLVPAVAAAQSAPDTPEGPSLRVGPVEVRPRLLFSNIGFDNNVFNERVDPKRDFTFTLAPDVDLSVHPGRLKVVIRSGTEFVYFREYESERSTSRSFSSRADLDLTVLRPFVGYSTAHSNGRPSSEIDTRARSHSRAATAGTRVVIASRTSMLLSATRSWNEFNDDEVFRGERLATTLNSETTAIDGSLSVELTPLTSLSLVAQHQRIRFGLSPLRDADSFRVGPSLSFSPLGLLSGTAYVGYRRFQGKNSALQDYSGLVAAGTLGLILGERFRIDTAFTRDVTYSYEAAVPYYVISGGRVTLASQVVGGLDLRVTGGRESMDYRALAGQESPGRDSVDIYGGGVGYRIAERVQFSVLAEYRSRHSTRDVNRQYDNNRIFATLNWGALTR